MTTVLLEDLKVEDNDNPVLCNRGLRHFFKLNDLSWRDFLQNGIPAETLEATGDGAVLPYIEAAKIREAG